MIVVGFPVVVSYRASKVRMSLVPSTPTIGSPLSSLTRETKCAVTNPFETLPGGSFTPEVEVSYSQVSFAKVIAGEPQFVVVLDAGADNTRSFEPIDVAYTVCVHRSSSERRRSFHRAVVRVRPKL